MNKTNDYDKYDDFIRQYVELCIKQVLQFHMKIHKVHSY